MRVVTEGGKDVSVTPFAGNSEDDLTERAGRQYAGPFARYVAIGDSTTEGLDDPDGYGSYRGWANRFAESVFAQQGHLLYANLAVRGLQTREILDTQLSIALAMKPDLSTVVSGTNDVLRPSFSVAAYRRDVAEMQGTLIAQGATVLTFTLPDLSLVNPSARMARARVELMNQALREVSARTGAIVVDLAKHELAGDPRMWSRDRLHANSLGHARIAAALAHAVGLPGSDNLWATPLDKRAAVPTLERWADHAKWSREYLVPWLYRRIRGRSSADGKVCKRPNLSPVIPVAD
ncbi:MAG: SGNH/GDSL hydrolase family protein [Gemmatimonadaceae bacterium]